MNNTQNFKEFSREFNAIELLLLKLLGLWMVMVNDLYIQQVETWVLDNSHVQENSLILHNIMLYATLGPSAVL